MERYNGIEQDPEGVYVYHAEAQQRISDLQGQVQALTEQLRQAVVINHAFKQSEENLEAALDAERVKVKGLEQQLTIGQRNLHDNNVAYVRLLDKYTQLQALVRAVKPYVASWLEETYGDEYVHHPEWKQLEAATLDATTPAGGGQDEE